MIKKLISKIIGSRNDKELKRYQKIVEQINALESKYSSVSDEDLQKAFDTLKIKAIDGESLDNLLQDSFAITREASKRILNMRHFDVQLIGGIALHEGRIAEMKTGEGKTLVATLPVILNAMTGKGAHVVTVNDYLAKRDAEEMSKLYNFLGYSVGVILSDEYDDELKKQAYGSDITYGTNNEFGFDYLRDNMKYSKAAQVQREYNFAIVDEVDSILIDEARTPLIISGPAKTTLSQYEQSNEVALALTKDEHFVIDEKNRVILLTEKGVVKAEELFGVHNLYEMEHAALSHRLDQALKANFLFSKDVDYIVRDTEVIIVDEFTGRLSEGKRYSEGLHQALEAKEGVLIKEESQTLADITFQNYFRLYGKLAGMTGTAQTEATEFAEIYGLEVISIPTNVEIKRKDLNDLIYKTEEEKFDALLEKVRKVHAIGQPILIGTASIEKSEVVHLLLKKANIPHTVLNAKNHEGEAEIIKKAGLINAVTVATNMAGRGVDVRLGDGVRELGGLAILGTERHESRRIDNQLRGRSGRQGDVGLSQFYLSLDDTLLRIFGSEKIKNIMDRLGLEKGECIDSKFVTNAVEKAQKRVESMNYESRKHLLEYDDVANAQRKIIYKFRNELLDDSFDIDTKIIENRTIYAIHLLENAGIIDGLSNYDMQRLEEIILEDCGISIAISNGEYSEIVAELVDKLTQNYEYKISVLPPERRSEIEKILILQILDESWREHLYQMDILKTGIGLRGYNQKDPLTEYKKESFRLFSELIESIKVSTMRTLHAVRFEAPHEEQTHQSQEEIATNSFATAEEKRKKRQDSYAKKKS